MIPSAQTSCPCPQDDLELFTALVALRQRVARSDTPLLELTRALADARPPVAQEAVTLLNQQVPMAAMPERWVEAAAVPTSPAAAIPVWIRERCADWGTADDFPTLAAKVHAQLHDAEGRVRLLERMALFPGARRRFADALKSTGQAAAVRAFGRAAARLRRQQFPLQIGLSPTMVCQLRCSYCISAGHEPPPTAPAAPETYLRFLDWALAGGVRRIGLSGGEPTLYPDFAPLVDGIVQRGMEWFLASNGLMPAAAVQAIVRGRPLAVTLHLTEEVLEDAAQRATFTATARHLVEAGINAVLRINILQPEMDIARYLDIAAATGMREVRAAVPMPNAQRQNAFVATDHFSAFGEALLRYVREGRQRRLQTILTKPFPLCHLPAEAAETFLANGSMAANCPVHMLGYSNNIVVSPDLSYIPCLGLNRPDPTAITSRRSPRAAARPFIDGIRRLTATPLLPQCTGCPLWHGGRCVGACLSYRIGDDGEVTL